MNIAEKIVEKNDGMGLLNAYLNVRYRDVTVEGIENLPAEGPGLIVSNHERVDDSFHYWKIFQEDLGRTVRFGVMAEVFDYPGPHGALMRAFLKRHHQISVDRLNKRSALQLIDAMGIELQQGELCMLYPESTTPLTGKVHRFHVSAAEIAIRNEVPVTIAHIAYPEVKHSLRSDAVIQFSPAMQPQEFDGMDRKELSFEFQKRVSALGNQAMSTEFAIDPIYAKKGLV